MSREKLIYIASPYAGDIEANTVFAKKACRYAIRQGYTPIAVHLLYPQMLDDSDPAERETGLRLGHRVQEIKQEALPAEMEREDAPEQSMDMV